MTWTRLNIVVEGHAEEEFANEILKPHLARSAISVSARMVGHRRERLRKYKGGLLKFEHLRRDLDLWMRGDGGDQVRFTTMVDLYAYPKDAPHYQKALTLEPYDKVKLLETGMAESVGSGRFIPHIQLHEFETLLFTDLGKWTNYFLDRQEAIDSLADSIASFDNIEMIDDGQHTAPSKRILDHLPEYDKVVAGNVLAMAIGLPAIRSKCRHFNDWLTRLEDLGPID